MSFANRRLGLRPAATAWSAPDRLVMKACTTRTVRSGSSLCGPTTMNWWNSMTERDGRPVVGVSPMGSRRTAVLDIARMVRDALETEGRSVEEQRGYAEIETTVDGWPIRISISSPRDRRGGGDSNG